MINSKWRLSCNIAGRKFFSCNHMSYKVNRSILYLYTGIHGRPQRVEGSFTKRKNNEHGSVSDNTCGEDVGTGIADKQHSLNTQWISAMISFGDERVCDTFWLRLNIRELSERK